MRPLDPQTRRRFLIRVLTSHRTIVQAGLDTFAWAAALTLGIWARFDFEWAPVDPAGLIVVTIVAVLLQWFTGMLFGLYRGRWRFGSFDEVAALARSATLVTAILFVVVHLTRPRLVPLSVTLIGGFVALVGMGGFRYLWRLTLERLRRPSAENSARMLVFGAGEGGFQVVTAMLRDPSSIYVPVAMLDDNRAKRNLKVMGVPVVGTRHHIASAAQRYRADTLLVAIPSADSELITEIADLAIAAGLKVKVLPPVSDLLGAGVNIADIRPLTEEDFLGRHVVETDIGSIADYLTGKRVLVTGAGGSIGSELCRQIYRFAPAELIMLDRDESALQEVQLTLDGRGLLDSPDLVLCDIRDGESLREVFTERRPQVVFHAAALKHVPLLEQHPYEAVKTNIFGTLLLLEAAAAAGVERFVNISTDKAADPVNVLGYSKRICERITAFFAQHTPGTYMSVRFGNVLGSRGSMLGTFRTQIANGGPVTITHPEVTRYFMVTEEAVQLVIQAGAVGRGGEVLVLDMGEQVRIADVAKRLIAQAERPVDVVYTGLRAGERLHERLLGEGERPERPAHPLIAHVPVEALDPRETGLLSRLRRAESIHEELRALCRTRTLVVEPDPDTTAG